MRAAGPGRRPTRKQRCAGAAPFPWRRVSSSRQAQTLWALRVPQSLRVLLGPAGARTALLPLVSPLTG